ELVRDQDHHPAAVAIGRHSTVSALAAPHFHVCSSIWLLDQILDPRFAHVGTLAGGAQGSARLVLPGGAGLELIDCRLSERFFMILARMIFTVPPSPPLTSAPRCPQAVPASPPPLPPRLPAASPRLPVDLATLGGL